jgi:hypothetical protein
VFHPLANPLLKRKSAKTVSAIEQGGGVKNTIYFEKSWPHAWRKKLGPDIPDFRAKPHSDTAGHEFNNGPLSTVDFRISGQIGF